MQKYKPMTFINGFLCSKMVSGSFGGGSIPSGGMIMAVSGYGMIEKSTDNGSSWKETLSASNTGSSRFRGFAISGDGKYQLAGSSTFSSGSGAWISSDFGENWNHFDSASRPYDVCAMSSNGQYMAMIQNSSSGAGAFIHQSSDYGATWGDSYGGGYSWISMSSDGRYRLATRSSNGIAYLSNDYGASYNSALSLSANSYNSSAISSDGKYQYIIFANNTLSSGMYCSTDYGATWNYHSIANSVMWTSSPTAPMVCSDDGKYLACSGRITGYRGVYVSSDYGVNWTKTLDYDFYSSIGMSSDGKYICGTSFYSIGVGTYLSSDYGSTWTKVTDPTDPVTYGSGGIQMTDIL